MPLTFLDAYQSGEGPGAAYGLETEDLDVTVVAWPEHFLVPAHVNSEVDVAMVVLSGSGVATIDGAVFELRLGSILVIPKGTERSIRSRSVDFRYVNIHKRKRKLMPAIRQSADSE